MKFTNKQSEAVAEIMERCFDDGEFCRSFKKDPKSALEKISGAKLPGGVQVEAIESTPERWVFVVPSEEVRDTMNTARRMDDQSMSQVTGGTGDGGAAGGDAFELPPWLNWWVNNVPHWDVTITVTSADSDQTVT